MSMRISSQTQRWADEHDETIEAVHRRQETAGDTSQNR